MSGAIRTQQLHEADFEGIGLSPERFEEPRTMKAFIGELERWRESSPDESIDEASGELSLRRAAALLAEDRDNIRSARKLLGIVRGWAETNPSVAAMRERFETTIAGALLGALAFKHVTASEVECLRETVFEPLSRLEVELNARQRETWQVVEALCLIMDARIHNEQDILAKMDRMPEAQFELTQQLLRRLLWDNLDYSQFRRVVYAFYVRGSARRSKLGYADFEYAEMLSYMYDFGQTSMDVYAFMAWKAANPSQLSDGFRQAIVHFFEFEGRGLLRIGAVRKTLQKSHNSEFNALIRDIRLEQSGMSARFMYKHWGKLLFAIAVAGLVALCARLFSK